MELDRLSFDFEYRPTEIVFGRSRIDQIQEIFRARGLLQALVVCGTNVGANPAVMKPVSAGLGDRLGEVFAETTPDKKFQTVQSGVDIVRNANIDCIVAVGGGSSINVARAICLLNGLDRPTDDVRTEATETGEMPVPDESTSILPNVIIPTTMAGADLTYDGGVRIPHDSSNSTPGANAYTSVTTSDPRLMPEAVLYDPELFATTPSEVLSSSAMNGFNKGMETVYSRRTNPISEAHALQGLRYLRAGLPSLRDASSSDKSIDYAVIGTILVQYGRYTNLVHTFGNGISAHYDVQQGTVHGIMVPHVLRYIFDRTDARRAHLASALGCTTDGKQDGEIATEIIDEVVAIRDALGLPSTLRCVKGLTRSDFRDVAVEIASNHKHARNPPGISPTIDEILEILETAW